jgi:hypothetical protein
VRCGDKRADAAVEEAVAQMGRHLRAVGPDMACTQVVLSFYERIEKTGFFTRSEEHAVWEQWIIPLVVNRRLPPAGDDEASVMDRERKHRVAEEALSALLLRVCAGLDTCADVWCEVCHARCRHQIIVLANERKDHIPPVKPMDTPLTFDFKVRV